MSENNSNKLIETLYNEENSFIVEGKPWDIPEKGSLGLLALGYKGLIAWRKKRRELISKKENPGYDETK